MVPILSVVLMLGFVVPQFEALFDALADLVLLHQLRCELAGDLSTKLISQGGPFDALQDRESIKKRPIRGETDEEVVQDRALRMDPLHDPHFTVQGPQVPLTVQIEVVVDPDGDGPTPGDPFASYEGNPVVVGSEDLMGLVIHLSP